MIGNNYAHNTVVNLHSLTAFAPPEKPDGCTGVSVMVAKISVHHRILCRTIVREESAYGQMDELPGTGWTARCYRSDVR